MTIRRTMRGLPRILPGTPSTVTVTGATAPSAFAGQTLTLNFLGGTRTLSSYVTSLGTFQSIQVASANFLRRNLATPTPSNNIVWNFIVSNSGTTYNLAGSFVGQESTAFGGRDLNFFTGTDTDGGAVTANGGTIVGPMGTLTGDGTLTTPSLINNGTVAPAGPGSTAGALAINGNYEQGSNGALSTGMAGPVSSQADQLNISGSAALNGALELNSINNFHPSSDDTYTILTAGGGVTGSFTQVLDSLNTSGLTRTLIVAPNGVIVTYLRPAPVEQSLVLSTNKPIPVTPLTDSQKNNILVPVVDPTAEQLTSLYEIRFSDANTQRFNIENRFDDLAAGSTGFVSNVSYPTPPPTGKEVMEGKGVVDGKQAPSPSPLRPSPQNRWGVWVSGYGDFVNVDDDGAAKGYDFTTGGVSVGVDYRLTQHFVVGLMGGYSHSWTDLTPSGSIDVDTGWGGVYAGYFNHHIYFNGAVYGGHYTFDSARSGLLGVANGSSGGGELSTYISGGYDFQCGHLRIGPTSALQYTVASLDGFTERGSVAPLKVSSDSQDSLVTDFGFRAEDNIPVGRLFLQPFVRAAWEHEYNYSSLPITASLADIPNSPTKVNGPRLGHDSVVINAGLSAQWTPHLSTYVSYDGELGRGRYDSNGVSGGLRISF
jgi:outer membrane autotransporter protein